MSNIIVQTYRFNLCEDMAARLAEFAIIHQYDHRNDFKEAWEQWIQENENASLIESEIQRLTQLGFQGNVLDKMFKSARFYYRKRSSTKPQQSPRKPYESIPAEILESMDKHIHSQIQENIRGKLEINNEIIDVSKISPTESFILYCNENKTILLQQTTNQNSDSAMFTKAMFEETIEKLKKTYKNRFYNIRTSYNTLHLLTFQMPI